LRGPKLRLWEEDGDEPIYEKLFVLLNTLEVLVSPTYNAEGFSNILANLIPNHLLGVGSVLEYSMITLFPNYPSQKYWKKLPSFVDDGLVKAGGLPSSECSKEVSYLPIKLSHNHSELIPNG
jgi:hypothetical protein